MAISPIPSPLITAFDLFHKAHGVWRWYRRGTVYTDPDNFFNLAAGHGLNILFGDNPLFKASAKSVLVVTRTMECIQQQKHLEATWTKWLGTIKGDYPQQIPLKWEVKEAPQFLSSSTVIWFQQCTNSLIIRVQQIAYYTFRLGKDFLFLSMRIYDAVECFSFNPEIEQEGKNEFFVNLSKWFDKLVNNKEIMIKNMESQKDLLDKILNDAPFPITSDQLVELVKGALEKTEQIKEVIEPKNEPSVKDAIIDLGKKHLFEAASIFDMHHKLPEFLRPTQKHIRQKPDKPIERFPPKPFRASNYESFHPPGKIMISSSALP